MSKRIGLVIDTCARWTIVGLLRGDVGSVESLFQETREAPRDSFRILVPLIKQALDTSRVEKPDYIVATLGPGSFTGIRVGVSAARNLSQLWKIPALGVPSLAFYLYDQLRDDESHPATVMIDAKQQRVYAASASSCQSITPHIDLQDMRVDDVLRFAPETRIFCDDIAAVAKYPGAEQLVKIARPLPPPRSESLYLLGLQCGAADTSSNWEDLLPIYLRSDPATAKYPQGYRPT